MTSYKTCEKGSSLFPLNSKLSNEYCDFYNKKIDTKITRIPPKSLNQRFFEEKWADICEEKPCTIDIIKNTKDARNSGCYPTVRIDNYTGTLFNELSQNEKDSFCNGYKQKETLTIPPNIIRNIKAGYQMLKDSKLNRKNNRINSKILNEEITKLEKEIKEKEETIALLTKIIKGIGTDTPVSEIIDMFAKKP